MIVNEAYKFIKSEHSNLFDNVTIEKVVIGIFFTAVKLSSGYSGISKTEFINNCHFSQKQKRNFGVFSPGKFEGQKVTELFEQKEKSEIIHNVRLAVLNAISSEIISRFSYKVIEDKDPIDFIDLDKPKTICIVGAFQSYIDKFAASNNKLYVLELNENALSKDQKKYFVPASHYKSIFAKSDVIIITGSTIANNTLDNLIKHIPEKATAILVGPSSSLIPDVIFSKNIQIIGSIKITNSEKLFTIVSQGGSGYHLFKCCAKKICLLKNDYKNN